MGFATYHSSNNFREYLSTKLAQPLVTGVNYTLSFYLSNGTNNGYPGFTNQFGIHFSEDSLIQNQAECVELNPTIKLPGVIKNAGSWKKYTINFVADSDAEYMTIGVFASDQNTTIENGNSAYYFIDDIELFSELYITGKDFICEGTSTKLTAWNDNSYKWYLDSACTKLIGAGAELTVSPKITTTYYLTGSEDTISYTLEVIPAPEFNLGPDTSFCEGESIVLDAYVPSASYHWNTGHDGRMVTIEESGLYHATTYLNGCTFSDSISITVFEYPWVKLGADTSICPGESIILEAAVPGASYLWEDGNVNHDRTIETEGLYWVDVTRNGCTTRDSINISIKEIPQLELGADTILCPGETLLLKPNYPNAIYSWNTGSGAQELNINTPGHYWLEIVVDQCKTSDSIYVEYKPDFPLNLGPDLVACEGESIHLDASTPNATYLWQDLSVQPQYTVNESGLYWVEVSSECGVKTDSIDIQLVSCECEVFFPNAFSPDGNGLNELFKPTAECLLRDYHLQVFNRWGELLFESFELEDGWDGTFMKKDVQSDLYIYVSRYQLQSGHTSRKGYIYVLR